MRLERDPLNRLELPTVPAMLSHDYGTSRRFNGLNDPRGANNDVTSHALPGYIVPRGGAADIDVTSYLDTSNSVPYGHGP
jgi:hypothetical protein